MIAARIAILRSGAVPAPTETVDRLTGLPDRATMQRRLVELLHHRVPFAIAVADIDGFAALNEQQGRDAGDYALQIVAQVARRSLRPDDLLGRIGGDEFLIVFPTRPATRRPGRSSGSARSSCSLSRRHRAPSSPCRSA